MTNTTPSCRIRSAGNARQNMDKQIYAKKVLTPEQFRKLEASFNELAKVQMIPLFILAGVVLLEAIFVPNEIPSLGTGMKGIICVMTACVYMIVIYPIWLIITQFAYGKLWHKFSRWYEKGKHMEDLDQLFEE